MGVVLIANKNRVLQIDEMGTKAGRGASGGVKLLRLLVSAAGAKDLILVDVEYVTTQDIETKLWD